MIAKSNQATPMRPEGDRVLDNNYVFADLQPFIRQVMEEKVWTVSDRNAITIFKSPGLTVTIVALKHNAELKGNQVEGFFSIQLLKGKGMLSTSQGNIGAVAGNLVVFHPQVTHSFKADEECVLMISHYTATSNQE